MISCSTRHCKTPALRNLCLTNENLFANLYIINLPSIIGIQFIDGVGENIVKLYNPIYYSIGTNIMLHLHHLKLYGKDLQHSVSFIALASYF